MKKKIITNSGERKLPVFRLCRAIRNGADAIYGEVYSVYIKIIALDGEMSDNDIRDVINSVNGYVFTKKQSLNSYYADKVNVWISKELFLFVYLKIKKDKKKLLHFSGRLSGNPW